MLTASVLKQDKSKQRDKKNVTNNNKNGFKTQGLKER